MHFFPKEQRILAGFGSAEELKSNNDLQATGRGHPEALWTRWQVMIWNDLKVTRLSNSSSRDRNKTALREMANRMGNWQYLNKGLVRMVGRRVGYMCLTDSILTISHRVYAKGYRGFVNSPPGFPSHSLYPDVLCPGLSWPPIVHSYYVPSVDAKVWCSATRK